MTRCRCLVALVVLGFGVRSVPAQEAARAEHPGDAAGHSGHGEVFDEGPRQAAYLMPGVGKVRFPVSTKFPEAQQFVEQGLAQLHGFWYFEAERSFRQAATLDPNCAMAYWGMTLANLENTKRSKGFLAEAVKRKAGLSERETLYIDAVDAYLKDAPAKKKERAESYAKALEKLLYKYPDDIEAKALLGLQLWLNKNNGTPLSSFLAVDALLQDVLAVEPMHPCHHYVIHLWDYEKADKALASSARCGQAAPAIAHMWHMPGHIYSKLHRYHDAVYQQEASARVDHAHMMRDRVLPDQIHNFAHNNEWLIRNLSFVGRVHDAVDLSKNMIELPRHPKYNTLSKLGSAHFGRQRLFETLGRFELWDELIALADTPYLEPTDDFAQQVKRLRALGEAHCRNGDSAKAEAIVATLAELLRPLKEKEQAAVAAAEKKARDEIEKAAAQKGKADQQAALAAGAAKPGEVAVAETVAEAVARTKAAQDAEAKARKESDDKLTKARNEARAPHAGKVDPLEKAIQEIQGHAAVAKGDYAGALELFKKSGGVDDTYLAVVQRLAGKAEDAEKLARRTVDNRKNDAHSRAVLIDLLWKLNKKDDARKAFDELRGISSTIDRDVPAFARLDPIAKELGYPEDWRSARVPPTDVGDRPDLATLGPFRWQPSAAPEWSLADADGKRVALADYRGRPVVVIFYLGHGCLHCVEQLHKFAPKSAEFAAAGISLVAIGTDTPADLAKAVTSYGKGPFPIPLLSNADLSVFKAYRAHDDFEQQPLHGTFLIDGEGRVRWQDISFEPFNDADFVLKEAQRLLKPSDPPTPARPDPKTAATER